MDMFWTGHLSLIEKLPTLWRLKCTIIIEHGPQSVSSIEIFLLFSLFNPECPFSEVLL